MVELVSALLGVMGVRTFLGEGSDGHGGLTGADLSEAQRSDDPVPEEQPWRAELTSR